MTTLLRKLAFPILMIFAYAANAQTHADGMTAMQLDDWDKAIKVYDALVKANPADQTAWLTLANAYLAKGDKANSEKSLQSAFNAKPEGAYALVANGRIALLRNDDTEATNQFRKAAKNAKKDVTPYRLIGESFLFYVSPGSKRPNYTRAETELKAALDVNSKDFATLMSLGYTYKVMPNGGLAAQNYEYAESLEPKNPLPKLMLAKVYKAAKLPEKFESNINKAIAVGPTFTPALRAKAEYYFVTRKWAEALTAYKDLVANGTEVTIEDEMQLANTLYINKDCKATSELVEKILKKDGTKNYLRRLQAYCDYENGDYQRGLDILNDYFKVVTPEKVLLSDYLYLGRLQLKTKGDTSMAISNLQKSIQMDSSGGSWELNKEIAEIQYSRKDYCGAVQSYKVYLDSLPATNKYYISDTYKMGLAQFYCKDPDTLRYVKAENIFKIVAEKAPQSGLGWLWAGKAAAKQDPDVEKHPELIMEFGKAKTYFETYVSIASADKVKNKTDLIAALEYLTYYYYNQGDAANVKLNAAQLLELAPTNETGLELMKAAESGTLAPATPPSPATPTTPANGTGGKGKK
ncbi:MAG: tetratricopeptide repeat protein [Saprospiraceae bacterium]|nr:tetratricopeptide repeat protein [Saprospiraceae bacterium]